MPERMQVCSDKYYVSNNRKVTGAEIVLNTDAAKVGNSAMLLL